MCWKSTSYILTLLKSLLNARNFQVFASDSINAFPYVYIASYFSLIISQEPPLSGPILRITPFSRNVLIRFSTARAEIPTCMAISAAETFASILIASRIIWIKSCGFSELAPVFSELESVFFELFSNHGDGYLVSFPFVTYFFICPFNLLIVSCLL